MELNELREFMNLKPEERADVPRLESILKYYKELRDFVDNLNLYAVSFIENYIDAPFQKWYQFERKPWLKDKCVVGLMGRYSVGKTTVLNTLLNLNLPINEDDANTALPTYIAYGNWTEYRVLDRNGEIKQIPERMVRMFDHVYSGHFPFSKIIKYMVLNQPAELLRKISFLDTPGVSKDKRDLDLTASVVDQCDVIFWLARAQDGDLDKFVEIPFLKKRIVPKKKDLYIVVTFADQTPDLNRVKRKIMKTLKEQGIPYKGMLEFSIDPFDMAGCLRNIQATLLKEAGNFAPTQPIASLRDTLEGINQRISHILSEELRKKNNLENEQTECLNKMNYSLGEIGTNLNFSTRELNALINTVNSRCSHVMFCNATYQQLQANLEALINRYNNMIQVYNDLDIDEIIRYGKLTARLEDCESSVHVWQERRDQCIELLERLDELF